MIMSEYVVDKTFCFCMECNQQHGCLLITKNFEMRKINPRGNQEWSKHTSSRILKGAEHQNKGVLSTCQKGKSARKTKVRNRQRTANKEYPDNVSSV